MTPKKVWGVIIIVLGILCFFNGAMICAEVESDKEAFEMLDQQFSIFTGKNTHTSSNIYKELTENEPARGVANSLIGIAMAIIGTMMLSDKKNRHISNNYKTNCNISNEAQSVNAEQEKDVGIKTGIIPLEKNKTDNHVCSIMINDKQKIKAAKIINMQSGKDELESEETRWMRPEDREKMGKLQ